VLNAPPSAPSSQAAVCIDDFVAYMRSHSYMYKPARQLWPASSVNGRLGKRLDPIEKKLVPASVYLDRYQAVEQITWAPGEPMIVEDRLVSHGG
jgi:hypothetical protein